MFFRHQKILPKDKMLVNSLVLMIIMITFDYLFVDKHPVPTDTEDKTEKKFDFFDDIELDDIDLDYDEDEDDDDDDDDDDDRIYDVKRQQTRRQQPRRQEQRAPADYYDREMRGHISHPTGIDNFQPYNS
jgi:hypothetical protein